MIRKNPTAERHGLPIQPPQVHRHRETRPKSNRFHEHGRDITAVIILPRRHPVRISLQRLHDISVSPELHLYVTRRGWYNIVTNTEGVEYFGEE